MAKPKISKIIVSAKMQTGALTDVRIVAETEDKTYPYGDVMQQLTTGDKNSLIAVINKIIRNLEA